MRVAEKMGEEGLAESGKVGLGGGLCGDIGIHRGPSKELLNHGTGAAAVSGSSTGPNQ